MASRPSDEERREFEERGWFHLGRVFDDVELADLREAYDAALAHPLKLAEKGRTPFLYTALLHEQSGTLRRFATDPRLVEPAVALLGPDVRLYWDQAVCKGPGATSEVPWHQDNGYTQVLPEQYVTMTLALDATTRENGCLWIQPGSHRHGFRPHERTDTIFFRGRAGEDPGVPVEQPEGDVLVFSSLTMHRTGPNRTEGPRRSWVIQFCDAATRTRRGGVPMDDRLWVAKDGVPVAEPWRERPLDLRAIVEQGRREGWGPEERA